MSTYVKSLILILGLACVLGTSEDARAQADPQNYLFSSGQTVQPVFAGWAHNADGSFEMHFGYLNRNYVEELHIPIGANNRMEPGNSDQGQPTFFYPRENHRQFSVTVPSNWGDKELVWQVTVRDETYRAIGWLQAEWEIAAGSDAAGNGATNQAPTLSIETARTVSMTTNLTMKATDSDDGLPLPRERRGGGASTLPTFEQIADGPTVPVNVPALLPENRSRPTLTKVERVNVTWKQWHGSTGVTLEPLGESMNGASTVNATFAAPGDYVFRVQASDGAETTTEHITITVQ